MRTKTLQARIQSDEAVFMYIKRFPESTMFCAVDKDFQVCSCEVSHFDAMRGLNMGPSVWKREPNVSANDCLVTMEYIGVKANPLRGEVFGRIVPGKATDAYDTDAP